MRPEATSVRGLKLLVYDVLICDEGGADKTIK
jgi:hypothetical protein